jgi:hypothetical protein
MANNYVQATVEPLIPKVLFTDEDLNTLSENGVDWEDAGDGLLYFFIRDGFDEDYVEPIFREALKKFDESEEDIPVEEDLTEIIIQGAFTCSKMRPGEFGGFVTIITKDGMAGTSTAGQIERLRRELRG